jgi:hypothetical protein
MRANRYGANLGAKIAEMQVLMGFCQALVVKFQRVLGIKSHHCILLASPVPNHP